MPIEVAVTYCNLAGQLVGELRNTFLVAQGVDIHVVQKILGHSQVALTANLYSHSNANTLRPNAEAY